MARIRWRTSSEGDDKSGQATIQTCPNQGDDDNDEIGDNPLRPTELVNAFDAALESFGCKYMESKDQGDSEVYITLLRLYGEVCCPEPSPSGTGRSTFEKIYDAIETAIETLPNRFQKWLHFFELEPGPRVENVSTIAAWIGNGQKVYIRRFARDWLERFSNLIQPLIFPTDQLPQGPSAVNQPGSSDGT